MLKFSEIKKVSVSPPTRMPRDRYPEYFMLMISSILGIMLNLFLAILFYFVDVMTLSIVSILSIVLWLTCQYYNYSGKQRLAIFVASFELVSHTIIAVLVLGTGYGFQLFLWASVCMISVNPQIKRNEAITFCGFCLLVFVGLHVLLPKQTSVQPFGQYQQLVFIFIVLVAAMSLMTALVVIKSIFIKQRRKLEKLANFDALTGLHNRRFFNTFLDIQKTIAKREKSTFCVALGDIDHFKSINDTYGHDIGDEVLIEVSKRLNLKLRIDDGICRWGGEEFIVFLPFVNLKQGVPLVNKMRAALSNETFTVHNIRVTMSFGVAESDGHEKVNDVIKRADQLLYLAKEAGRNTVMSHR